MKIETKVLNEFLKAVKMSGEDELKEVVFNFSDAGLQINGINDSQTNMSSGLLRKEVFKNYEAIGKIGIQEMSKIIKILEWFTEPEIKVINNELVMEEGNKVFETELLNIEFIHSATEMELSYEGNAQIITFNLEELKDFINETFINGKYEVMLSIITNKDNKQLVLKNNEKYKFTKIYNMENINNDIVLNLGSQFFNAIDNLVTEKVDLILKTNFPVKIISKNDNYEVNIIVAPKVIED